jgi:drug/metabolite transporter (DMT)-like permease
MTYTQLIWAAIIGFFLFGELPGASMWSGAAVIVAACFYVMRSSNKVS